MCSSDLKVISREFSVYFSSTLYVCDSAVHTAMASIPRKFKWPIACSAMCEVLFSSCVWPNIFPQSLGSLASRHELCFSRSYHVASDNSSSDGVLALYCNYRLSSLFTSLHLHSYQRQKTLYQRNREHLCRRQGWLKNDSCFGKRTQTKLERFE